MTKRREFIRKGLLGSAGIAIGGLVSESGIISSFKEYPGNDAVIPDLN